MNTKSGSIYIEKRLKLFTLIYYPSGKLLLCTLILGLQSVRKKHSNLSDSFFSNVICYERVQD